MVHLTNYLIIRAILILHHHLTLVVSVLVVRPRLSFKRIDLNRTGLVCDRLILALLISDDLTDKIIFRARNLIAEQRQALMISHLA